MASNKVGWSKSAYDNNNNENPFSSETENGTTPLTNQQYVSTNDDIPSEPPVWLQDTTNSKVQAQAGGVMIKSSGQSSTNSSQSGTNTTVEMDAAIPRMILYTRVTNLVLSVCMILASLLSLLTTESATTGVLACYVVVFSCLLCCFETHLKQIAKIIALNFGFMYSAKSRCAFMIFVGTILFSFSLFGKIIGCAMLANAGFNIFILFKYPQYEDAQRNDAQSEIRDYLSANPAFAKTVVKAGTEFVLSNPDIVKKSAESWATLPQQEPRV